MKMLPLILLVSLKLFANEEDLLQKGEKIFNRTCSACHLEQLDKKTALKSFKTLKAPPMNEVAQQLKSNIVIKDEDEDVHRAVVIAFIRDYIKYPTLDKTMCNPGAIDTFGLMPSQAKVLTEEEIKLISTWLYDRYEGVSF